MQTQIVNKGAMGRRATSIKLILPEAWLWREGERDQYQQETYSQEKVSQIERDLTMIICWGEKEGLKIEDDRLGKVTGEERNWEERQKYWSFRYKLLKNIGNLMKYLLKHSNISSDKPTLAGEMIEPIHMLTDPVFTSDPKVILMEKMFKS